MTEQKAITVMLEAAKAGDPHAAEELFDAVYGELRTIAKSHRRRWQGNETLNTTALIHEAFIKLAGQEGQDWQNRTHFYATAAKAMRHILVNYAERQKAAKRGGGAAELPLDGILVASEGVAEEALALHQALESLEQEKPRLCQIVECRFFGGMSIEETAEALSISPATVKREWNLASAWLYRTLHGDASD